MAPALRTLTALIGRVVRFELSSHFVDFVEKHFLLIRPHCPLQRPPESGVACMRVVLMVEGKQPAIAHHAVVKAR